ncbi:MAG: hypothetical protein J7549_10940 [Variovorax sp.]|nr:hypothetical protein [Variovorax sp.]
MNSLRRARRLVSFVLMWFALSLGAAIASPVVHPQAMEVLCSASGVAKVVIHTDDGVKDIGASHLDCPMCLPGGAPPPAPIVAVPSVQPLSHAVQSIPAARLAAATAAPLPARGPPALL